MIQQYICIFFIILANKVACLLAWCRVTTLIKSNMLALSKHLTDVVKSCDMLSLDRHVCCVDTVISHRITGASSVSDENVWNDYHIIILIYAFCTPSAVVIVNTYRARLCILCISIGCSHFDV